MDLFNSDPPPYKQSPPYKPLASGTFLPPCTLSIQIDSPNPRALSLPTQPTLFPTQVSLPIDLCTLPIFGLFFALPCFKPTNTITLKFLTKRHTWFCLLFFVYAALFIFQQIECDWCFYARINTFDGGDSPAAQIQEAPTGEEDSDLRRKSFVGGV